MFRLAEYVITVPPLRARPEDIPFLARRFLTQAREALGRAPIEIAPAALDLLCAYRWPGNARELRNVMRRAALTAAKTITADHLADSLGDGAVRLPRQSRSNPLRCAIGCAFNSARSNATRSSPRSIRPDGNKAEAARLLGIDYKTYRTKLKTLAERHGAQADGGS